VFHKKETSYSWWYICQILTNFKKNSCIVWFSSIKNPITPSICCHTTLWNTNARKQSINDKLQGTVVNYLRGGGIKNKIRWIFGKVTSKKVVVSGILCAWQPHCQSAKRRRKFTTQSTFLPVTVPNIHRFTCMGLCYRAGSSSYICICQKFQRALVRGRIDHL